MSSSPIRQLPVILIFLILSGTAALHANEFSETGIASWYGGKFQGRKTANGETFDTNLLTAAHKTLPFGTIVKVVNLQNEKSVQVRINDRGPFVEGRIIDLSRAGADAIGMVGSGVARVRLEIVSGPKDGIPEDLYRRHEKGKSVTIQVASFSLEANAERTRTLLMSEGIPALLERSAGGHFRVVIRNVDSTALPGIKTVLARLGYSSVLVREKQ